MPAHKYANLVSEACDGVSERSDCLRNCVIFCTEVGGANMDSKKDLASSRFSVIVMENYDENHACGKRAVFHF